MKQNLKNFNFCNFNFDQKQACVNKNELSILEHYNLKVGDKTIKPVYNFVEFFKTKFGTTETSSLFENYPDLLDKFIFVSLYEFYNEIAERDDFIIFAISNTLELYEISFENLTITSLDISFENLPTIFENNSKYYFYSEDDKLICFDKGNSFISVSNFVDLIDYINFQDKTFFTVKSEPNKVYYTETIDIEEIDESLSYNNISLSISDGKILKLVKFKGNLYIIQQYAISKLAGTEKNYYLNSNCNISAKIYKNSISKVNDYIIFYTTSGLYLFDGNEIKHIFVDETSTYHVTNNVKGIVFNNKYYFLTNINLGGNIKRCLTEFDIYNSKSCNYFVDGLEDIYLHISPSCYELMVITKNLNEYKILNIDYSGYTNKNKYLKFNDICFDDTSLKRISAIKLISDGEFDLQINSDKFSKTFHVKNNMDLDNLGIQGYLFQIIISSDKYFELKSILISVESILE